MEFNKKLNLVERATWESLEPKPGQEIISTPTWVQLTSPLTPNSYMNGILRCELSEKEIDQKIANTIQHYRSKNLPFYWRVAPSSKPVDLSVRLEKNGFTLRDKSFGLFAEMGAIKVNENTDVQMKTVTLDNLEDWLLVQANAWQVPPAGIEYQRQYMKFYLQKTDFNCEFFIAYIGNVPAGTAAIRLGSDYGYLIGGAVNDNYRNRGIYKTLISHRLKRLNELGLPSVIHCLEKTSAPICLKLGFEKICEIYSYELS